MTRRKDSLPASEPPAPDPAEAAPESQTIESNDQAEMDPSPSLAEPPAAEPPPPAERQTSGVLGPILGGAVAAVGGFAVSHFDLFGLAPTVATGEIAELSQSVAQLQNQNAEVLQGLSTDISAVAARVAQLESAPSVVPVDQSRIEEMEKQLEALAAAPGGEGTTSAVLVTRLAALEGRIAALPTSEASPDLQAKLDAAIARLDAAEAEASMRATEADNAKAAADRDRALDALRDAVDSGGTFTTELNNVSDPDLAAALGPLSESGVPTLGQLKDSFPDAARAALGIARDLSDADGWGDRFVDFLSAQTGARSLVPREGNDPDAVLSRAEFALSEGRVADALAEIETLDPSVMTPFAPWREAARAHLAAASALQSARGE
jgi:hypothetical protein